MRAPRARPGCATNGISLAPLPRATDDLLATPAAIHDSAVSTLRSPTEARPAARPLVNGVIAITAATSSRSAATWNTWLPDIDEPQIAIRLGSTSGQRLRRVDGGAVVLHLTLDRNRLAWFAFRSTKAAVVEREHVRSRGGEALGERFQPGVLGSAEAVGHHDHRTSPRSGQSIGLGTEVPSAARHAMGW